jgi:hypothetical protein
MALFGPLTQAGNTTTTWICQGGNITNHEAWATQLEVTSPTNGTGLLLGNVVNYINPTRYAITVTVKGPQAVSYHLNSNQV